jgi:mannose-6-phosphate isomerase
MPCDHGLSPLIFDPVFKEKVWGGRALERRLNKNIPHGLSIGESWELSAIPGNESKALIGPFARQSLATIFKSEQSRLIGDRHFRSFPLLYKFIDSNEKLSVQVHPGDQEATKDSSAIFGKTECWFVVDAKPGAEVICGFKAGVGLQDVKDAIASSRLPELCNHLPIKPGEVIFVPAGTVHALLEGVLIYEVQQTSDTTFRLYDWGRVDKNGVSRPLHVRQSLQALDMKYHDKHTIAAVAIDREKPLYHAIRAACRYFALEEYRSETPLQFALSPKNSFQVVTVLNGELKYSGVSGREKIAKGETLLVPACLGSLNLNADEPTHFLVSYVPDIAEDIIKPLLQKGVSREAIAGLGGNPFHNDVIAALGRSAIGPQD